MSKAKKQTTKEIINSFLNPGKDEVTIALGRDVSTAVLIVSLTINFILLTGWLIVQMTSVYDGQVTQLIFG